jgi:hypothetical protein
MQFDSHILKVFVVEFTMLNRSLPSNLLYSKSVSLQILKFIEIREVIWEIKKGAAPPPKITNDPSHSAYPSGSSRNASCELRNCEREKAIALLSLSKMDSLVIGTHLIVSPAYPHRF